MNYEKFRKQSHCTMAVGSENQPNLELFSILVKSIRCDVSSESRNVRSDVHILLRNKNKAAGGGTQRGALLIAEQ